MDIKLIKRGSEEHVSLDLAKEYLREETNHQDNLIKSLIKSAIKQLEAYSNSAITVNTYKVSYGFDDLNLSSDAYTRSQSYSASTRLPFNNVQSIESVTTVDQNGTEATFSNYTFDKDLNTIFWNSLPVKDFVKVELKAGFKVGDDCDNYVSAILAIVSHLYENRTGSIMDILPTIDNLVGNDRRITVI